MLLKLSTDTPLIPVLYMQLLHGILEFNLIFADFDGFFRLSLHIEPHHIDRILLLHPIVKLYHLQGDSICYHGD